MKSVVLVFEVLSWSNAADDDLFSISSSGIALIFGAESLPPRAWTPHLIPSPPIKDALGCRSPRSGQNARSNGPSSTHLALARAMIGEDLYAYSVGLRINTQQSQQNRQYR